MRFVGDFKPQFHKDRLNEPKKVKKPSKIFADSMSDFWGKGVKQEWRDKVYKTIEECPQHIFQILTKQPQNIKDIKKIPKNVWVGVSISNFEDRWRIASLISKKLKNKTFVSIEPILTDNISCYIYLVDWIIIGALTGRKKAFRPMKKTIKEIIKTCRKLDKPLFIKDNLNWDKKIQEFPRLV